MLLDEAFEQFVLVKRDKKGGEGFEIENGLVPRGSEVVARLGLACAVQ